MHYIGHGLLQVEYAVRGDQGAQHLGVQKMAVHRVWLRNGWKNLVGLGADAFHFKFHIYRGLQVLFDRPIKILVIYLHI